MARRIYLSKFEIGRVELPDQAQHHLVNVLRLADLSEVEPFTTDGRRGRATLHLEPEPHLIVHEIVSAAAQVEITVASAVPKGERADYLVEKLAELGVARWVPLETERAVVLPKGDGKRTRWERIAQEAARQSHAGRVLQIGELIKLGKFVGNVAAGTVVWFGSTGEGAETAGQAPAPELVVIGPEGGFTPGEEAMMREAGWMGVTFGETVLRVETAAVVGAFAALARRHR